MGTKKASTRVYILLYLLMYSDEPFVRRWNPTDAERGWLIQFSALDLAARLNCSVRTLKEQLGKAGIIGVLEPIRVEGNSYLYRVLPLLIHTPTTEEHRDWVARWRPGSRTRPTAATPMRRTAGEGAVARRKKRLVPGVPSGDAGGGS